MEPHGTGGVWPDSIYRLYCTYRLYSIYRLIIWSNITIHASQTSIPDWDGTGKFNQGDFSQIKVRDFFIANTLLDVVRVVEAKPEPKKAHLDETGGNIYFCGLKINYQMESQESESKEDSSFLTPTPCSTHLLSQNSVPIHLFRVWF